MSQTRKADPPAVATQGQQIAYFVKTSGRDTSVPIRRTFVQKGHAETTAPGPLATFVTARDERALDLYLLLLLVTSREPFTSTRDARMWARALGISGPKSSGSASISKAWARLAQRRLIAKERAGRWARVELLSEDGSGAAYLPPGEVDEQYFRLPFAYWIDGYINDLRLPGKACLLIALSRPASFALPSARAKAWYGVSADTLERGFGELRDAGVLSVKKKGRPAPEAPEGYVVENIYRLRDPFVLPRKKKPT